MKHLFLTILTVLSLSATAQEGTFEVVSPITFNGINDQLTVDSIRFSSGEIVSFKESFGVLIIKEGEITVRTDLKNLRKLQAEGKIKIHSEMKKGSSTMNSEQELLRKINRKLNFLVGAVVASAASGIFLAVRLLRGD